MPDDIPDIILDRMHERLNGLGLTLTRDQVREVDDWVAEWDRGRWTLVKLCQRTGWPLPADAVGEPGEIMRYHLSRAVEQARRTRPGDDVGRVRAVAEDIAALRHTLQDVTAELRTALADSDQGARDDEGTPRRGHREKLVRTAERGMSRANVFKALSAGDILTDATNALRPLWRDLDDPSYGLLLVGNDVVLRCCHRGDVMAAHNRSIGVLEALRDAGLTPTSDGPAHTSVTDDLANGLDIVITRTPAASTM